MNPLETPLISIIIPTYNSGSVLTNCLNSLAKQELKNFEVLVVDNASEDSTLDIARSFSDAFFMFTLISEQDRGIYDAMNKGIALAKAEWLYFLGSDDIIFDDKVISTISEELINTNYHVVYGDVIRSFYGGGRYGGVFSAERLINFNLCHQSIFFNKWVFKTVGTFNLKYKVLADWDHNLRWFYNKHIHSNYIDLVIAHFSDEGLSSRQQDNHFMAVKNFKILKLGFNILPTSQLRKLCRFELEQNHNHKNIFKILYLKGYLLILKFQNFWNHNIKWGG